MKSKPVQIKRVVPEFTEIIPEPGDPEVGLLDFIDPEQPHYHEKFPSDRSEVLYEFGDRPYYATQNTIDHMDVWEQDMTVYQVTVRSGMVVNSTND
jgi:hypothetical protein